MFTADDVFAGQLVFEKYGLMEYGTIFGHGAYLGPDFTADYIERARQVMLRYHAERGAPDPAARVIDDWKINRWDAARDVLVYTPAEVAAWHELEAYYRAWFGPAASQRGLRRPTVAPERMHALVAYIAWSAWVATANRPGKAYSYTNNWPPAPAVGNTITADAILWSAISLIALLGGIGATLFAFGRFRDLGWPDAPDGAGPRPRLPSAQRGAAHGRAAHHSVVLPRRHRLAPAARAVRWRERALPTTPSPPTSSASMSRRGSVIT